MLSPVVLLTAAVVTATDPTPDAVGAGAAAPTASAAPVLRRYSFADALERAGRRNPSVLTAEQEILRAEAIVREVRASSLPILTGNAIGTRLDSSRGSFQQQQSLSANVTLAVPIVAPQRWVTWSHASENADVTRVSATDIRRSLLVATARSYLSVITQQRVLEVADRAFVTAKAHYDFAHQRRQGGVGNRLDEVRAQQEVETTRASAELARSSLARAQEALGVVLAEDAPVDVDPEVSLGEAPLVDAAVSDAASRRTDVKVLATRLTAAEHVLRDSYADYLPSLVAQAVPFYNNPGTTTAPRTGWQAQLVLSLPLYDGGLRYGVHDERQALVSEAQVALDAALRQVQSDVRTTYQALRRADAALEASRNAARLAGEALDLANQAYRAGATTNLEVIDAERRARDADTAAAVAEDTARQARLDLLAASGRFP